MKKLFWLFTLPLFVAVKLQAQTDLVARIHFLGGDKISADKNSLAFTNEFASPEARALENQTLDKLANFFAAQFKTTNDAAQLRPLLNDFLKSEWIFEMRDANNGSPEYALAICLSPERAQLWKQNLQMILENWTGQKISQDRSGTWWLQKHNPPNLFQFSRSGDWVVIDCGENQLPLANEILAPFLKTRIVVPETNWLSADLDWPRLTQLFPVLRTLDFPKIAFQVVGRDGNFHVTGNLRLSQPLPPLENWRVPTNVIHQPLISFTAARGMAPWLEGQKWFQPFELSPQPDQFFVWAMPQIPFQTFAAEPVPDADAALARLYENLSANANWQAQFILPLRMTLTNNQLSFTGMPFFAPNIRADREIDGNFLVGGFFPNTSRSRPLPPGLFEQLNAPNLVYYHWEVTAERLKTLPQLSQLLLMLTDHRQLIEVAAAQRIEATPGSSVTCATEVSPTEVSFARSAPNGLTAVELLALVDWLDSPNFPSLDLHLPPRLKLKSRLHQSPQFPGMPAPVPSAK